MSKTSITLLDNNPDQGLSVSRLEHASAAKMDVLAGHDALNCLGQPKRPSVYSRGSFRIGDQPSRPAFNL